MEKCDCAKCLNKIECGGTKNDAEKKYRPELLPHRALMEVIKVFTDGAKEYGDFNWKGGIAYSRLYGAIQRHLLDYWNGKDVDGDSGLPALAHAIAGLMMLQEMSSEWDDRPENILELDRCLYLVDPGMCWNNGNGTICNKRPFRCIPESFGHSPSPIHDKKGIFNKGE